MIDFHPVEQALYDIFMLGYKLPHTGKSIVAHYLFVYHYLIYLMSYFLFIYSLFYLIYYLFNLI
jgi:hypothetical protein